MLTKTTHLKGLTIRATDGELGTVDQLYFDDKTWAIRYLTVETGGWLGGRGAVSYTHLDVYKRQISLSAPSANASHFGRFCCASCSSARCSIRFSAAGCGAADGYRKRDPP